VKWKHSSVALTTNQIVAYFGAYNLSNPNEINRFSLSPSNIIIHDDWNSESDIFDADIAILVFDEKIHFTRFIKPACVWKSPSEPTISEGVVTGWGKDTEIENRDLVPNQLKVPVYKNEECFLKDPNLARFSSIRTFCAGSANGTGMTFGDGGSGLYTKHQSAFYLTGMVSSCKTNNHKCDLNTYSVFANVLKFKEWIWKILKPTNDYFSIATR
jgi:hypothetical protein